MGELKGLKNRWEPWKKILKDMEDLQTLYELASEEKDESQSNEIEEVLKDLQGRFEKQNIFELMSGEVDRNGCYLTVHSGAGGPAWARIKVAIDPHMRFDLAASSRRYRSMPASRPAARYRKPWRVRRGRPSPEP